MWLKKSFTLFPLLFLLDTHTSLSFPLDSFVYEANPIQKLTFPYSNSTKPLKFKLQTVSFKVYEQLAGLYSDEDTHSDKYDGNKLNYDMKLSEIEKKYKELSRFTVFYNNAEAKYNSNVTNNKLLDKINHQNATGFTKAAKNTKESEIKSSDDNSRRTTEIESISSTTENDSLYFEITTDANFTIEHNTEMAHDSRSSTSENDLVTTELPDYISEFVTTENINVAINMENWTTQSISEESEPTPTEPYEDSQTQNTDKSATNTTQHDTTEINNLVG